MSLLPNRSLRLTLLTPCLGWPAGCLIRVSLPMEWFIDLGLRELCGAPAFGPFSFLFISWNTKSVHNVGDPHTRLRSPFLRTAFHQQCLNGACPQRRGVMPPVMGLPLWTNACLQSSHDIGVEFALTFTCRRGKNEALSFSLCLLHRVLLGLQSLSCASQECTGQASQQCASMFDSIQTACSRRATRWPPNYQSSSVIATARALLVSHRSKNR